MDSASGLQRFQSILAGPKTEADLAKVIVQLNQPGGESHQVALRPPLTPSGGFLGAIFGRSQKEVDTEKASSDALATFRQALVRNFGQDIGTLAARSLKERTLTVLDARTALTSAQDLKNTHDTNLSYFQTRLEGHLALKGDAKGAQDSLQLDGPVKDLILGLFTGSRLLVATNTNALDVMAKTAATMVQTLRNMPGASEARAREILTVAAATGDPMTAAMVVKDLAGALTADRPAFDGANVNGAATEGIVKNFNAKGRSELGESGVVTGETATPTRTAGAPARTPAQLHGDIAGAVGGLLDSQRLVTIALEGGTQTTLCRQLQTDSNRGEYTVNGKHLTVPNDKNAEPDKDAFAAAFRASFPAGEKGDRLALLASACMNQFCLNPTMEYVGVNASLTPAKAGADLLSYDAWQRDDGSWGVRCAMLRQFDQYIDHTHGNDIVDSPGRCACLGTVEFTIDMTGAPRLAQVATDVVFSGKVGR